MPQLSSYTIGDEGHFVDYASLVCPDDADAIAQAKSLANDRNVELWSGPCFIVKLESKPR